MMDQLKTWAQQFNKTPQKHLNEVKQITSELSKHIDGEKKLSESTIQQHIEILTCYTSLSAIPLPEDTEIIRAVKYEESTGCAYDDVQRLSYISQPKDGFPEQGRINKNASPLFYGCISNTNNSRGTALSECNASENDTFNILKGTVSPGQKLLIIPIGVNDYFRRGMPNPFNLHQQFRDTYDLIQKHTHPTARMALLLCDAFLNDILTRQKHGNIYDVTSQLGEECLKPPPVDGILYSSTKFEGYPSIAIKPSAIDQKINFNSASAVTIQEEIGYGMYSTKKIRSGIIKGRKIQWRPVEDQT
jgi:hypothetical protein